MMQQTFVAGPDAAANSPDNDISSARRWGTIGAVILGGAAMMATIAYFNRRKGY